MLKLLITAILSSTILFAKADSTEKSVLDYIKESISVNKNFTLKDVRVKEKKALEELKGWDVYFLELDLEMKNQEGKIIPVTEKVFTNGNFIARDFIDIKKGKSLKDTVALKMDNSFYNKEHLIYGDFNAPNKVVVFSDPVCPFCQDYVPDLIKFVKEHPKEIALFYYHFPLSMIHPEAPTLVKATLAAEEQGVKEALLKVYEEVFDLRTNDDKKILAAVNKALKTKITEKDIIKPEISEKYSKDLEAARKMMINGTPTIYVNGEKDATRQKYLDLVKK